MTRRELLCAAGAAVQARAQRPNILLLLGDNWHGRHAGIAGDSQVRTPAFDRLAREGVWFTNAFGTTPSCSPSRASMLTGQASHRLGEGAHLWATLPARFPVYPDLLEAAGYRVGYSGKGWAPGRVPESGRKRNPAGNEAKSLEQFLDAGAGQPFCFWFGSHLPHTPWNEGAEFKPRMDAAQVRVPPHLPDHATVRDDILNYYCEVEKFNQQSLALIELLERRGLLENTLVVMTADNGWQAPRGLGNVYDDGVHVPLALRWGARWKPRRVDAFVGLEDLAPTFLAAAGLKASPEMTGRSLLPLAAGRAEAGRDAIFLERERHANVRRGNLGYPVRAVRTRDFLYIRNLRPDRWPAGDPELFFAVGPYGDIDPSPTKDLILARRDEPAFRRSFELCFAKRPAEELYDLRKDPGQTRNLAADAAYATAKAKLAAQLDDWRQRTADPRVARDDDAFDALPYYGPPAKKGR